MSEAFVDSGSAGASLSPPSRATLVFLRGADADGRVRALVAARRTLRPALACLSLALVERRAFEPLGFRSLGDYAGERLGVGARTVSEAARVWKALLDLPCLRAAVLAGEVSFSVAGRVVSHVTPETEAAAVESVRGRTVRAVEAMLAAAFPDEPAKEADEDSVRVHVRLPAGMAVRWQTALELARRMAGEELPVWECAEAIAAEALGGMPVELVRRIAERGQAGRAARGGSAVGASTLHGASGRSGLAVEQACIGESGPASSHRVAKRPGPAFAAGRSREHGLRHHAFPHLRWAQPAVRPAEDPEALLAWARAASPHALDAALRRWQRREREIEHDLGQLLRQILDRRLHHELGFTSFDRYAEERAELAPRTARRWVRLARLGPAGSALAQAARTAQLTEKQALLVGEIARPDTEQRWIAFAEGHTLRRLEAEIGAAKSSVECVTFHAPREAASVFLLALEAARRHLGSSARERRASDGPGSERLASEGDALAWMIEHAILAWTEQGAQFHDYADFERDGYRCTAPGCTARRSLHSHHIVFRGKSGPDEPWNRTTLCAFHHLRGIHAGTVRCTGRAPEELVFELGVRPSGPALLRTRSGDVLL